LRVGAVEKLLFDKAGALLSALQEAFEKQKELDEARRRTWMLLEQRVGEIKGRGAGAFAVRKRVKPASLEPGWLAKLLLGEKLLSEPELSVVAELYGETGRVWIWTPLGKEIVTILDTSLDRLTLRDVLLMTLLLEPSDFEAAKKRTEEEGRELAEILEHLKSVAATIRLLL
jgi:hypothetical protein